MGINNNEETGKEEVIFSICIPFPWKSFLEFLAAYNTSSWLTNDIVNNMWWLQKDVHKIGVSVK